MSTFPISPTIGQVYTGPAGQEWQWNGYAWEQFPQYAEETGATGPTGATGATGGIQNGATGATGSTGINILSSGVVARKGSQSLPASLTLLDFPTEDFDIASEWNGTRFTAASSGYYYYYVQITAANNGALRLDGRKNGSSIADSQILGNERLVAIEAIVSLNIGDYLEFYGRGAPTLLINNNLFNYISIYKL